MHPFIPATAIAAVLLSACASTPTPRPAPALTLTRPDASHVLATLTPAPAAAVWTLRQDEECGAPSGPVRSGSWPTPAPALLEATRGDLLTATADGVQVADCVPPLE